MRRDQDEFNHRSMESLWVGIRLAIATRFSRARDRSLIHSTLGPSTWALAAGKNDMMTILISKLIDDGISLYKVVVDSLLVRERTMRSSLET